MVVVGGGYSEAYLDSLSNFKWGGILKLPELDSLSNFKWGGGILKLPELDSLSNFNLGGYSEATRAGLPVKFQFWGGYSEFQNRGIL